VPFACSTRARSKPAGASSATRSTEARHELPDPLATILAEYLDHQQDGQTAGVEEFLARYPDHRAELEELLPTLDELNGLAALPPPELPVAIDGSCYRLIRELGRGGMGVVYLAEMLEDERLVAIKVLTASALEHSESHARFAREVALAKSLRHPNLVSVYGSGSLHGAPCLIAEYVPGADLGRVLADLREQAPPLSTQGLHTAVRRLQSTHDDSEDAVDAGPAGDAQDGPIVVATSTASYYVKVAQIIAEVADALEFAHQRGVVHRDVKPRNILVDAELTPRLTDFGLARQASHSDMSRSGDPLGTPHYMSPEMLREGATKVDHRTDIYSLGVTLYELLTLSLPFSATSSPVLMRRIELTPTPWPRRRNPEVPDPLQAIVLRAMEKHPDRRYPTAAALAEDLRRFLRGQPVLARTPGPLQRAGRWVGRHRILAGTAAALALGLVAAQQVHAHQREADRGVHLKAAADSLRAGSFAAAFHEASLAEQVRPDLETQRLKEQALGLRHLRVDGIPPDSICRLWTLEEFCQADRPLGREVPSSEGAMDTAVATGEYVLRVSGPAGSFERHFAVTSELTPARRPLRPAARPDATFAERTRDMVQIPAGTYSLGHDPAAHRGPNLFRTASRAQVPSFWIDRTEVSNGDYLAFVRATGHRPPSVWEDADMPPEWRHLPVTGVSYDDALAYAAWIGKRLPTEAEWEVAARGAVGQPYPYGTRYDPAATTVAPPMEPAQPGESVSRVDVRTYGTSAVEVDDTTTDVSPFGVLHLGGNVAEWVLDPWRHRGDQQVPAWLEVRGERTIKGGSWRTPSDPAGQLAAARSPEHGSTRILTCGFRCAMSHPDEPK